MGDRGNLDWKMDKVKDNIPFRAGPGAFGAVQGYGKESSSL